VDEPPATAWTGDIRPASGLSSESVPVRAPRVTAIVLNFRLAAATLRVVEDLRACGFEGLETIVVENGSGDGSAARLRAAWEPEDTAVTLIAQEENLGYCGGVNLGLAEARRRGAQHVLLLNNDCRVPPGFLGPLVDALDADPSLAAVSPTVVTPDGLAWCEGGFVRARPNLVVLRGQGQPPAPITHGPEACEFLPGACVLYRLSDLQAVGDLDESYFMYWEDVDLGARLRAAGRRLVWLPWQRVVHEPSGSSGGGRSPLRKFMSAANTVRYLRRHGTPRLWLAFWCFDVLLWPLAFLSGTPWRALAAKARGFVVGLSGRPIDRTDVERYAKRTGGETA
jgi:GT2 family glycosyltransferase